MSGDAAVQADERCLSNELTGEGLSSSRVRQAHIVLGMALDSAVHDGIIARNTARRSGVKLSEHAAVTVRTGMYCSYQPDPRSPVSWSS